MNKNIIELNGKRYDAITGALLGQAKTSGPAKVAAHRAASMHKGRVIDGVVSSSHSATALAPQPKHHAQGKPKTVPPPHHQVIKKPGAAHKAHAGAAHQPEKPKTLMRHVVKKPTVTMKPAIKPQAPAEIAAKPVGTLVPKLSVAQVSPARLARAKRTPQSRFVKRFDFGSAPVAARPATSQYPVQQRAMPQAPASSAPAATATQAPTPKQPSQDLFEAALASATSHQQPAPHHKMKRRHSKLINVTAAVTAFLIIGGFVAYLNVPNIEMRVASMHAGFSAQLPGYKPTGFAMNGGVQHSDGKVRVSFRSGDQAYTITQQASDWDSQTLLDNSVALGTSPRQTVQSKGRTIYLFNNHASWVSAGVRYDITGNAQLNPSDVASIAASM